MASKQQMLIGLLLGNGYGSQAGAWRWPGVDPTAFVDFDTQVRHAQMAERGKLQFLFMPDFSAMKGDIATDAQHLNIEPIMTLAAVARGTTRIGMLATGSTTFTEPFNLARQFKTLDLMSHGRAGWNAMPTSDPAIAANYGRDLPSRNERYERLHEVIQIVQALTYWSDRSKRQFVVVAAGGHVPLGTKLGKSLIAYALPNER